MGISATPRQRVAWLVAILVVVRYALLPVVWMISLSLKPAAEIGTNSAFVDFGHLTFKNYSQLFNGGSTFTHALINSIGIAAISTLIAIVLAAMAAYALARLNFAG